MLGYRKLTAIEVDVYAALTEMGIGFDAQTRVGPWVPDALLADGCTVIECQGDYYHVNPAIYPDGATLTATQGQNKKRDTAKQAWYAANGYRLICLWESDIKAIGARALLERELGGI